MPSFLQRSLLPPSSSLPLPSAEEATSFLHLVRLIVGVYDPWYGQLLFSLLLGCLLDLCLSHVQEYPCWITTTKLLEGGREGGRGGREGGEGGRERERGETKERKGGAWKVEGRSEERRKKRQGQGEEGEREKGRMKAVIHYVLNSYRDLN